ncbi:MAG: flagellar hook-length control protein FliK [Elusimicrobiota bacterium]
MNVNLILEAINQKDIKSSGQVFTAQGQNVKEGNNGKFSFFRDLIMKKLSQNELPSKSNTDGEAVNVNSLSMLFLAAQMGMLNNNSTNNNILPGEIKDILPEDVNNRLNEIFPEVMASFQDFIKAFSIKFQSGNPEDLKSLFSENLSQNISSMENLNFSPQLSALLQNPEFIAGMENFLQNPEVKTNMADLFQNPEVKTNMADLFQNPEVKTTGNNVKLSDNNINDIDLQKNSNVVMNNISSIDKNVFDNLLTKIKDSLSKIVNMAESAGSNNISTGEIFAKYPFLQKLSEFIGKIEDFQKNSQLSSSGVSEELSVLFDKSLSLISTLEKISKEFSGMENKDNKNGNKDSSNIEMSYKNIDKFEGEEITIPQETGNISSLQNKASTESNIIEFKSENSSPLPNEIDLSDQIVKKIDWKITKNLSEATISLEPEYLGKLRVELQVVAGGEVSARFFAQTKEAGDILLQQLNQLKTSLAEQGLKLGSFSVFTRDSSSSGFQNFLSYNNSGGKNYSPINEEVKENFSKPAVRVKTSQMDYLV